MKRRTFGLVFERHQPEAVELPGHPARRGDKVRVLPPSGARASEDSRLWRVESIERIKGSRVANLHFSMRASQGPPDEPAFVEQARGWFEDAWSSLSHAAL